MPFDLNEAKRFVTSVDLSGTPRGILSMGAATEAGEVFDQAKTQAQVVASGLFAFAEGVDAHVREAISDSALLAQLVANQKVDVETDPLAWFVEYYKVLQNVGWTAQESGWDDYTAEGQAADVHEKIIEVLTAVLGPAPAALAIVKAAVNALKAMNPDSSWITIFKRESAKGKIARFQVGLAEKDANSDVFVTMLASLIEAKTDLTQVLLFKFKKERASFRARTGKVSINRPSLTDLGPTIRTKVRAYQADYLSSIQELEPATS